MTSRAAVAFVAAGLVACATAGASGSGEIAAFSRAQPGTALPAGWRPLHLPRVVAPEISLVEDGGTTVLRSRAAAAAGTVAHDLDVPPAQRPLLSWRWKVDRVVERADLAEKSGDDFAARVYVFYDVPAEALPVGARLKVLLARALWGERLPTAAICYVWDNRHAQGTSAWNPYTDRVRTVVLRSGSPGAWAREERDLEADFRAAFGSQWTGAVPRVTGIAAGNDTDQTGETVTAWFGDFRLEARR
jgi:hypothetical protein